MVLGSRRPTICLFLDRCLARHKARPSIRPQNNFIVNRKKSPGRGTRTYFLHLEALSGADFREFLAFLPRVVHCKTRNLAESEIIVFAEINQTGSRYSGTSTV
jgi:hypothetical protein